MNASTYSQNDKALAISIDNVRDIDTIQSLTIDGVEVSTPEFEAEYGDTVEAFIFDNFDNI